MARRTNQPTQRAAHRDARKSSATYWLLGAVALVLLVCVVLFSRNDEKDRLAAQARPHGSKTASIATPSEPINSTPRVVKMRRDASGVYYIPARVNGQEFEFCFDTGASGVHMSLAEALLLKKQGQIADEDFRGEVQSTIADGSVVTAKVVVLRTFEVAGVTLRDVEATISDNMVAPLLLGQNVMSQFGSFTMDYKNSTVTFR